MNVRKCGTASRSEAGKLTRTLQLHRQNLGEVPCSVRMMYNKQNLGKREIKPDLTRLLIPCCGYL